MMGTLPPERQPEFFSYRIDLERRVRADHPLRKLNATLDLSFVIPLVKDRYGRCGNVSIDPRVIVKMMLLLFYYNIPSERELMAQIPERLDFLWFLGYDLDSEVPDHSVLSKARARWGTKVFETLFVRTVEQCVEAGLVDGRLLHVDSTTIKANASKESVVKTSPELVRALRHAYQQQERKLEVLPAPGAQASGSEAQEVPQDNTGSAARESGVNSTHVSRTDPQAQFARTKTGAIELSYKEHRLVDDAHGVITARQATASTLADGSQLPGLMEKHQETTGFKREDVTVAGDHHYGTASNYLFCAQAGIRAHLAPASANVEEQGKIAPDQFVYEPQADRLQCPMGHYLLFHQDRPEVHAKVYLIEDAQWCARCPLRSGCTRSPRGRSLQRHVQAEAIQKARQEARSAAARYSRKRRKHVMEGCFADASNNHGAKRSRWRGLCRQQIQNAMISAVQNLRILLRNATAGPNKVAASLKTVVKAVDVNRWATLKSASNLAFEAWHRFRSVLPTVQQLLPPFRVRRVALRL